MLSDTHTYALYNDAQVQMHSQTVCTRRFLFTEEIRDRSQRQARWEMRHNFQQFFFLFSVFFTYSLAQEQAVGRCLNIAYIAYITFPYSTQGAGKPEQEEGTLCFYVDQPSLLNILNLGAQSENQTYLLEVISRHDSSFWDPSL